jgi:hypothetical protein
MQIRCPIPVLAAAIALLGAPGAGADGPAPGVAAAQSGPKNYSKNAATGDYVREPSDRIRTSSLAGTTSAAAADDPAPPAGGGVLTAVVAGLAGVALGVGGTATIGGRR